MKDNPKSYVFLFLALNFLIFLSSCVSIRKPVSVREEPPEEDITAVLSQTEEKVTQAEVTVKKEDKKGERASPDESLQRIVVPGNAVWINTKIHVEKGQEVYFQASGNISLQKGNPVASCGPEGLSLKSMQQPLLENNMGALIGKVLIEVITTRDSETGEKTSREVSEMFFIGSERMVVMPASGSLWLGINENVVGDNDGEFTVIIIKDSG
ncbi:MAG: hypothetical protein WCC06_08540 [Candidatus Aminicenantales bacterium]